MVDKTATTRKGKDDELQKLIDQARTDGAVRVKQAQGDVYIVAPRNPDATTPPPFGGNGGLLTPPLARAAYSDRMAWLMASFSQIAYDPYETGRGEVKKLAEKLSQGRFLFAETFSNHNSGTQAFLARDPGKFAVLAFRGTEKDRKDIITDLNTRFYNTREGMAHEGFMTAFKSVQKDIEKKLTALKVNNGEEQLFITGHSLGGALATVAAKELENRFPVSACYTFGSPRVGNSEWSDSVKTPVYRVVNGADGVPLLPGGAFISRILALLSRLPVLGWVKLLAGWLEKKGFVGYQHSGDLRFLQGELGDPKLKIGSAALWARIRRLTSGMIAGAFKALNPKALSALFSDHAIAHYAEKLRKIAETRN